jgi:hypothetical protein
MVWYVVFGVVLLVVVVVLGLLLVRWVRGLFQDYQRLYGYLLERGVSKVEVIPPGWYEYGRVRLYDWEGRFLEELVVRKEEWWYCFLMCRRLEQDGFEVEVKKF